MLYSALWGHAPWVCGYYFGMRIDGTGRTKFGGGQGWI